jgi:hypothetical protein
MLLNYVTFDNYLPTYLCLARAFLLVSHQCFLHVIGIPSEPPVLNIFYFILFHLLNNKRLHTYIIHSTVELQGIKCSSVLIHLRDNLTA